MTVDKSASRVQQMFGRIARRYDLLNRLLSLGIDRRWRRRTVRLAPPSGEGPVLDLCTGTGDLALAYWRASGRAARIVGVDFCRSMLDVGSEKSRRAGALGHITLLEADALRLPFADNQFQVVSVAFGLRNLSDTDRGLREMVRVCRPGGTVAVLEFSLPRARLPRAVYGWYFRRVLPWVGEALARNGRGAYNYLPASVDAFPQDDALAERMRGAGMARVWYRQFTFGVATLYVGVK